MAKKLSYEQEGKLKFKNRLKALSKKEKYVHKSTTYYSSLWDAEKNYEWTETLSLCGKRPSLDSLRQNIEYIWFDPLPRKVHKCSRDWAKVTCPQCKKMRNNKK